MSIGRLLRQQVKIRKYNFGTSPINYYPPVVTEARIEYGNKLVLSSSGTQIVSSATVFLGPEWEGLDVRARVMMPLDSTYNTEPTATQGTGHLIANIAAVADGHGRTHHVELNMQ